MASYTTRQYADQQRTTMLINRANHTGLCAHCGTRPRGVWPDGSQMATCGRSECYHGWLRIPPRRTGKIEHSFDGGLTDDWEAESGDGEDVSQVQSTDKRRRV